jgi:hypothetical protein
MKNVPNSKTNLDKAILRFAGEVRKANGFLEGQTLQNATRKLRVVRVGNWILGGPSAAGDQKVSLG